MKIVELGSLQMIRTNEQHFGSSKIVSLTDESSKAAELSRTGKTEDGKSFANYLLEAVNTVNDQQIDVSNLQEKLITDPDDVDIHDVTIAMSKARMSLNLAQTVIDRLVTGWNEISTTR